MNVKVKSACWSIIFEPDLQPPLLWDFHSLMKLFSVLLFATFILPSCNDEPALIGSGFYEEGSLDILYIDTLTIKASTVSFDSLVTSDATRFLVGYHSDPDVGKLNASAIFQIAPDGALSLDEDFTTYSRATIVLVPDGYSYFDTSTHVSLSIHELTRELKLEDDGYLYSTSSFAYNEEAIGTSTFLPKPNSSDTLEIPLADSFGSTIFSMAQQESEEVSTSTAFIETFEGIAIIPDTSNSGAIIGYGISPEIRIYFWDETQTPSEEKYLTINGGGYIKYNKITQDREGTPLSLIQSQKESLSSSLTNNVAFVQAGTGLALRLEIPYLKTILFENDDLTLTDAVLEFYPIEGNDRNSVLPEAFIVSIVDYKNDFYDAESLQGYLIEDEYLGRDTRYEVDVRNFVTQQLATEKLNENALLFSLDGENFRQAVDIIRIGDQKSEKKMKLKLYCVVSKN